MTTHHKGPVNPHLLYASFVPAARQLADMGLGIPKNGLLDKRRQVHADILASKAARSSIPLPVANQGYLANLKFKRH